MNTPWKFTVLAAALAAGCAAVSPAANERLEQARASYRSAAEDPQVQRYAAPELQNAANALKEAERLAKEGAYSELVEHNAYLAERRARTALRTAQARQAEAELVAAREERRRAQLEARSREAAAAREQAQQAQLARQEAEARARQLEQEIAADARLEQEIRRLEAGAPGVRARQGNAGWILSFDDEALFEQGTMLRPDAGRTLDQVAQFLRDNPGANVAIEAPRGVNERLAARRAEAVKFGLVVRGVEAYRIETSG